MLTFENNIESRTRNRKCFDATSLDKLNLLIIGALHGNVDLILSVVCCGSPKICKTSNQRLESAAVLCIDGDRADYHATGA